MYKKKKSDMKWVFFLGFFGVGGGGGIFARPGQLPP